jgi:hypothetical protein
MDVYTKLFFVLILIQIYFDTSIKDCSHSILGVLSILVHHVTAMFGLTPFLHGYYELHLIWMSGVIITWLLFSDCIITMYSGKYCSKTDKPYTKFIDIPFHIMKYFKVDIGKEPTRDLLILVGVTLITYDLYMLYPYNDLMLWKLLR